MRSIASMASEQWKKLPPDLYIKQDKLSTETKQGDVVYLSDYKRTIETSISISKKREFEELRENYNFEHPEIIRSFLKSHEHLIPILYEAHKQIKQIFGLNIVELCIEIDQDPDEDYEGLSIVIKTTISPEEALKLYKEFLKKWWLGINEKLIIIEVRIV